jgi:hypothetical protein
LLVNGKPLATTFGTEGAEWHWQDGGVVEFGENNTLALHDLTGFEGRCECKDEDPLSLAFTKSDKPAPFPRCPWAIDLADKPFPDRPAPAKSKTKSRKADLRQLGGWFRESGFDLDPIRDMERIRNQNFRAMYGAWDAIKNTDHLYPNHRLKWAAFIAGKRESRRLLGDVVLTVDDFRKNRQFPDAAFPCTWGIDLHFPPPKISDGPRRRGVRLRLHPRRQIHLQRPLLGTLPLSLFPQRFQPLHGRSRHLGDPRSLPHT